MSVSSADLTLAEVNQAIRKILLTGVSHSRPGLTLTRANLSDLRALRRELIQETARANNGASFVSDFSGGGAGTTEADEWGD